MWENHSSDYWKERLRVKQAFQKKVATGVGGGVLALIFIWVFFHRGPALPRMQVVDRPIVTKRHMDDCENMFTHYHMSNTGECGRVCKPSLNLTPRPLMYNTCLEACVITLNKANEFGCRQKSEALCVESQSNTCIDMCAKKKDSIPMPKIHRHCFWGCQHGFEAACPLGKSKLDSIVDADWTRMKKAANPHLQMHEL